MATVRFTSALERFLAAPLAQVAAAATVGEALAGGFGTRAAVGGGGGGAGGGVRDAAGLARLCPRRSGRGAPPCRDLCRGRSGARPGKAERSDRSGRRHLRVSGIDRRLGEKGMAGQ